MNEKQAEANGYEFHGSYGRNKEEIKAKAKELRALGNKAVVITERDSPLSRGSRGVGYSVYWIESAENVTKREAIELSNKIARLEHRRAKLVEELKALDVEIADLTK